jgi:hypothetical protein
MNNPSVSNQTDSPDEQRNSPQQDERRQPRPAIDEAERREVAARLRDRFSFGA